MTQPRTRTFIFDVRETTSRVAYVKATSAAQARERLQEWADNNGTLDDPSDLHLGDMLTEGFTFRNRGSERSEA
jgi:hypothetical protein